MISELPGPWENPDHKCWSVHNAELLQCRADNDLWRCRVCGLVWPTKCTGLHPDGRHRHRRPVAPFREVAA